MEPVESKVVFLSYASQDAEAEWRLAKALRALFRSCVPASFHRREPGATVLGRCPRSAEISGAPTGRRALPVLRDLLRRNGDLGLAGLLALLGVYGFSGLFTPVRFERESIAVRVEADRIHVTGLYLYRNSSRLPTLLTLGIPFPTDEQHPMPALFSLAESDESGRHRAELYPVGWGNRICLRLFFRPGETKWIRLDYTQPTAVPRGRYLLTTTRAWRRPIAQASFRLSLPASFRLLSSNYALTPVSGSGGARDFEFGRTNFFPEQDWEFAWREAAPALRDRGGSQ